MPRIRFLFILFLSFSSSTQTQEQNSSSASTDFTPKPRPVSFKNIASVVEGLIAAGGNLLIVLAIACTKALRRKEMLIIAGLAFSEFIFGLGQLSWGIRRGWLELTGYINQPTNRWHCMLGINRVFSTTSAPFESIMLVILSVDRLLAVKEPLWYWKQRNKYAYICLSIAGGFTVTYQLVGTLGVYLKPANSVVTLDCKNSMLLPDWMVTLKNLVQALGGWGSVLCFVLVVYFYREHGKTLPNEQLIKEHMELQRKMTKTVGVCVAITLLTVCIGRSAKTILSGLQGTLIQRETYATISPLMSVFINTNMMANVFVYSWRQREIRAAIVRILTCGRIKLSVDQPGKAQGPSQPRNVRVAPVESGPRLAN